MGRRGSLAESRSPDPQGFVVTILVRNTVTIHAIEKTAPEENRELFIFENVDGEWKIGRYMFNKMAPAAQ